MSDPGIGVRRGSGGPYEERFGYSRVVRVGPLVLTAGCTATVDGQVLAAGNPSEQTRIAIGVALAALAEVGARIEQVVGSRIYITDPVHADAVGAAHGQIFGAVRPAATMVVVAGLIDPAMLVEIELTAWVG